MFRELRRSKQKLTEEKTTEILRCGEYGILSTCGEDGQPYGVPLNYVYQDGSLYFHCATDGQKLDNIAANCKVSFTVTAKVEIVSQEFTTVYECVIAQGKATQVQGREKLQALRLLVEKYSPDFKQEGLAYIEKDSDRTRVIKIEILNLCGKHGH